MKSAKKSIIIALALLIVSVLAPNFVRADVKTVSNEADFLQAINDANAGDVISFSANIVLTRPVSITDKDITINGNGFTVTRAAEGWSNDGANATLITAGKTGTIVHLMNMKLIGAEKYGVQSYNGAYVSLDGVTISDCGYGAVLVNAGTVEVRNLVLNKNGTPNNNGIEIAKGNGVYDEGVKPELIMNGSLSSTEEDNVIYLAVNDTLTDFDISNTDDSENKIFVSGNRLVVTDAENNIIFQSNENLKPGLKFDGDPYVPNATITINIMDKTVPYAVPQGSTISKEDLEAQIALASLGFENYTLEGFYTDAEFKTAFDFSQAINTDITVYAKLNAIEAPKPELDTTPKTGVETHLGLAVFVISISLAGIVALRRK